MGLRFLVSVPFPPAVLPHPALFQCADPNNSIPRRPDLLERLAQCARIFADNLGLMGDVAMLRERIFKTRAQLSSLPAIIQNTSLPVGLLETNGNIVAASKSLIDLLPIGSGADGPWIVRELFPEFSASLETVQGALRETGDHMNAVALRSDGRPLMAHLIALPDSADEDRKFLIVLDDQTETRRALNSLRSTEQESPAVVSRFLLDTVIRQPRISRRGQISYHVLARWRRGLQSVQVSALKALKADLPPSFVSEVARQLATEALQLFGRNTFQVIVPVPCGNSGPGCLSVQLASAMAQYLGVPMINAFEPIPVRGRSHPRRNATRPAMRLSQPISVPVLLVDDVATSGHHICEAASRLLAGGAPAVLPLVWIAP